jgi:hypothetical protein
LPKSCWLNRGGALRAEIALLSNTAFLPFADKSMAESEPARRLKGMPSKVELRNQIKARGDVQLLLASLYHLHDEHRAILRADQELLRAFSLIAGSAFSLWRAAFLTHTGDPVIDPVPGLDDCAIFIGTVARDNIISFAQDRESREWTVGYYLNNAVVRLAALSRLTNFKDERWLKVYCGHAETLMGWDQHIAMTNQCIASTQRGYEILNDFVDKIDKSP